MSRVNKKTKEEAQLGLLLGLSIVTLLIAVIIALISEKPFVFKGQELFEELPFFLLIIAAGFLAPIFEEFIFRYFIKFSSKIRIYFSILILVFIYFSSQSFLMLFIFSVILALLLYVEKKMLKPITFYLILFSSLAFSVSHVPNFFEDFNIGMIYFLLYFFSSGILLMILRIRFGLFIAIITHMMFNFIVTFTNFNSSSEKIIYNKSNNYISLKKQSVFSREMGSLIVYNKDTLVIKNTKLESILDYIYDKRDIEIFDNRYAKYSGKIYLQDHFSKLDSIFSYKKVTDSIETSVYFISSTPREGYKKLSLDNNTKNDIGDIHYFKRSLIGGNIQYGIEGMAKYYKVKSYFLNKDSLFNKKLDIDFYTNKSFEENIFDISERLKEPIYIRKSSKMIKIEKYIEDM